MCDGDSNNLPMQIHRSVITCQSLKFVGKGELLLVSFIYNVCGRFKTKRCNLFNSHIKSSISKLLLNNNFLTFLGMGEHQTNMNASITLYMDKIIEQHL